jgi:hypothetical protein
MQEESPVVCPVIKYWDENSDLDKVARPSRWLGRQNPQHIGNCTIEEAEITERKMQVALVYM